MVLDKRISLRVEINRFNWFPFCYPGNVNIVKLLIEKEADVNVKNNDRRTALDIAIQTSNYKNLRCYTCKEEAWI